VGRELERGETDENGLLSPALSSFFEEEREKRPAAALQANYLPNTTGHRPAVRCGSGYAALRIYPAANAG
jgi:hypothetical protein